MGRGAPARAHHRPRFRLDDAALGTPARGRRRPRARALRRQHAGRRRFGARGAAWWSRPTTAGRPRPPSTSPSSTPSGVRHALLAVTKADLADPAPVLADARERLAATSMGAVPGVAVSARTGDGLPELVAALETLLAGLPAPDPAAPVRLWIDRAFTIRGAGTVVTGTLAAGHGGRRRPAAARGPRGRRARRAVARRAGRAGERHRPRGAEPARGRRRGALPGRRAAHPRRLPRHRRRRRDPDRRARGAAARPSRSCTSARRRSVRGCARWTAPSSGCGWRPPLPLRVGDRLLLRDPGSRRVLGADVLRRRPARAAPPRGGPAARGRARRAARRGRRAPRPSSPAAGSCAPTTSPRWAGRCPRDATVHGPWLRGRRAGRRARRAGARRRRPVPAAASAGARAAGRGAAPGAGPARTPTC